MSTFHLFVQHPYWYSFQGPICKILRIFINTFYSRSTLRRAFFLFAIFAWGLEFLNVLLPLLIMVHLNQSRCLPSHILSFQYEMNLVFDLLSWHRFFVQLLASSAPFSCKISKCSGSITECSINGFVKMRKSIFGMKKHPQISNIYSWCGDCTSPLVQRHTSYLSFFLHMQNFWRIRFTPKLTQ